MSKRRDALIEATSAMPFSGRHTIRKAFFLGRRAAEAGDLGGKVKAMALLGAYAVLHGVQAWMGVDSAVTHAHSSQVMDTLTAGYDTLYALANAAVTYTQVRLLGKLVLTHSKEEQEPAPELVMGTNGFQDGKSFKDVPQLDTPDAKTDQYQSPWTTKNILVDNICTFGAQVLFLVTYRP